MIDILSITLRADPSPPAATQGPGRAAGILLALWKKLIRCECSQKSR